MSLPGNKIVVFITGGNTGLGFASLQSLLSTKSTAEYVLLMGPYDTKHQVHPVVIDIDDDEVVETAFNEVEGKYGRIDVLINNAGISQDLAVLTGSKTLRQAFNETFNTNVTSTHLFTAKFLSLLFKSTHTPRLVFISSSVGSLAWQKAQTYPTDSPSPAGWPKQPGYNITTYRTSKTAMNMMVLEWKRVLYNDGVKVFAVNPGYLATGLNGTEGSKEEMKNSGAQDVALGGEFVRKVVEGERDEDEGKLIEEGRVVDW